MVGRQSRNVLVILVFLPVLLLGQKDCSIFKREYCNMQLDKILMLDTNLETAADCQTSCFERSNCTRFTHFDGSNSRRCVLFTSCSSPISSCKNCISGPAWPRVGECLGEIKGNAPRTRQFTSNPRKGNSRTFQVSNGPTRPINARQTSGSGGCLACQDGKDKEEEDPEPREEEEDDDDNEVNIDDGLLDAVFADLPGNERAKSEPVPRAAKKPSSCSGGCYYCVMGGTNQRGAVSSVSVMDVGSYRVPRSPLISSFPSFMTQGNGRTFSLFSGSNLHTCTPGYYTTTFSPASTFGHPAHTFSLLNRQTFIPGSCNGYNFQNREWASTGGQMRTSRQGANTVNVGSYIMSFGGFSPLGQPLQAVDIFDPRRPSLGWQGVPQWVFPRATRDSCSVVTRDPVLGTQIMVMGGRGEEHSVMKLVLAQNNWYSVPPMGQPRVQHGCTSVTLNGRPGVVVSGGMDSNQFNTTSVEFFDINTHRWIDLPGLSRGRRGHTMTTIEGQLAVMGGAAEVNGGNTEYLDDVEIFDGRRWKRANYGLDQPRDGANIVKIPISTFSYRFG